MIDATGARQGKYVFGRIHLDHVCLYLSINLAEEYTSTGNDATEHICLRKTCNFPSTALVCSRQQSCSAAYHTYRTNFAVLRFAGTEYFPIEISRTSALYLFGSTNPKIQLECRIGYGNTENTCLFPVLTLSQRECIKLQDWAEDLTCV